MEQDYKSVYQTFLVNYQKGATSGEEVGEVIAKMAQFFSEKNCALASVENDLNALSANIVQSTDEQSGKAISVSKAEILIKSSQEYAKHLLIKTDIQNIEQFINALKYLQKGLLNEYSHMGSM
jgi:phosphoribosylamine-glycine ligase